MSEIEDVFGGRTGRLRARTPSRCRRERCIEPPELRALGTLGTLAELTSSVAGESDGLGPGSAVEPGS
jgi:hypothetical protein